MAAVGLLALLILASVYGVGRYMWQKRMPEPLRGSAFWDEWASASMTEPWGVGWRVWREWLEEIGTAVLNIGRGIRWTIWSAAHDWHIAHAKPAPPESHATVAILHAAETAHQPTVEAQALIGLQNRVGVLVQRGEERSIDETHELVGLKQMIAEHGERVVAHAEGYAPPPIQGLLGVPSPLGLLSGVFNPITRWAVVGALAAGGVATVQTARIHAVKVEARADRAALKSYQLGYTTARGRLDDAYTRVTHTQENCVAQLDQTSREISSLKTRLRIQQRKNATDEKASLAGGANVPVGDILRDLRPTPPAAAPAPAASDAAPGLSGGPGASPGVAP